MRILYTSILALVVVIVGYVLWWQHVSDTMITLATNWEKQRTAEGYEISHTPFVTGGFPYRVKLNADNLFISNPTHYQQPKIFISRFGAVIQPWQLTHVIFDVEGETTASWRNQEEERNVKIKTSSALASSTFNTQGRLETMAMDLKDVYAVPSWRPPLSADRLQLHSRPEPRDDTDDATAENRQQIALRGDNITIEGLDDFPLGTNLSEVALATVVHGTIEKLPTRETIAKWSDNGGFLQVQALKIRWGGSMLDGEGKLALDPEFRLLGNLDSRISGYDNILKALTASGKIKPDAARTIGFGLNLLAKEADDGTRYLTVPLSAEEGGLYLGPMFLMRLSPLFKD